jgi:MATE family, multidrug efflux pump
VRLPSVSLPVTMRNVLRSSPALIPPARTKRELPEANALDDQHTMPRVPGPSPTPTMPDRSRRVHHKRLPRSQRHRSTTRRVMSSAQVRPISAAFLAPVAPEAPIRTPAVAVTQQQKATAQSDSAALKRRVWGLAIPSIGEQLLALGVGLSDTFLAGHLTQHATAQVGYGQATAVDSVAVASTAAWIVLTVFFAINVGVTALVARATGAKDRTLAARAAGQGILLAVCIGLGMIALALPLASAITSLLGVTGQVAELASQYIRIFSLAMPAAGAASAINAAMRGAGDARRPLLVMLVVNGANVIGSWTLMNGFEPLGIPAIGVVGSAIGAACGWTLGCVLAIILLRRKHPRAPRLTRAALQPSREIVSRILRVGLPSSAELAIFQIGILTFNRSVIGLGPVVYAANATINTVDSLGTLPGFGFSVAATALVGQALGAGKPEQAERAVWESLKPCLLVMSVVGIIEAVAPHLMLGLFIADSAVLKAGDIAMRLSILTLPASAFTFVFNGALRGAGDTKFPVIVRAGGTWGMRVPLATMLLIPLLGLPGARLAMAFDFTTQAGLAYWRFRSGRWRKTQV